MIKEAKEGLAFSPVTGEVAAIGMLNPDTNNGAVFFQSPGASIAPFKENGIEYSSGNEKEILIKFWETVKHYDSIITFNGRGFDAPFLIIRSAIHKISPSKDLMPYRYEAKSHIDLLDHLTFYGSVKRRYSLHMWCTAFGIKSPKEEGITGHEVASLFREGRHLDIARYCAGDLRATKELFEYWDKYVRFSPNKQAPV
ncbi:MAG: ribonuclease H-like domain-containing protein [Nitrospirae bacterium]|nr:ribonuclease H-like domain-containing protein [Nitrospirota bacterium]